MANVKSNFNNECEEKKIEICIRMIKKQIEGVENLKNIWTEDKYLLRFLYSTEFDVDEAIKRIKGYHEHVLECPEFYPKNGPLKIKNLIEQQLGTLSPNCDREGRRLYFLKPANINAAQYNLTHLAELDDTWFEYALLKNPEIAGKGLCYVIDIKNHSYGFIKWFNIPSIKMGIRKIATLPFKEFVIHIVNKSIPVQILSKVAVPMLPESSRKQVKFHFTNWESLHKYIDPKFLPQEYGGTTEIDYSTIYQNLYDSNDDIVRSYQLARGFKTI